MSQPTENPAVDPRAMPGWGYAEASAEARKSAVQRANSGERLRLLAESDWTQLPDVAEATRLAWRPYRQALRDITDQPGWPFEVVWPKPPQ
jgi:hypothetical protein